RVLHSLPRQRSSNLAVRFTITENQSVRFTPGTASCLRTITEKPPEATSVQITRKTLSRGLFSASKQPKFIRFRICKALRILFRRSEEHTSELQSLTN